MTNIRSKGGEEEGKVVGLSAVHESNEGAISRERPLENGLQETMRGNLYSDGVWRDFLKSFLKQDWR